MGNLKLYISIIIMVVGATTTAIWHFAPMDLALANQEKIAMLDAKGELSVWEDRKWELWDKCVDPKTDKWICSDDTKRKYDKILLEIELLRKKLGLDPED